MTQYGISTFTSEISLDHLVKSMEVLNRLEKERKGIYVAILITKSNFVFFYLFSSSLKIILKTSFPEPRHWILINH